MICDNCKEDFDQSECWMEDWEDAPMCIDCRVEVQEAIAASWYETYTPAEYYAEDAYDVTDPKHSDWVDRVMEQAEVFAGVPFPKVVRS